MARKARGRGEGSIYQRADGYWVASISTGYGGDGTRRRRTIYGKTKQQVQDKLSRLQVGKLDGTLGDAGKTTLAAYLERWLEDVARPTIRHTTFVNYERMVKSKINPRVGGVGLSKLNPAQVQGLYATLEREGASGHVRRLVHAVLHRALKQAVKWNLVARNVCDAVEAPRVERKEIKPLRPEQAAKLLFAATGDRLRALYVLAIDSGLRLGELFGLQWDDVDLEGRTIIVRRALAEVNGRLSLTEPKTTKSRRRVDLSQAAVDALHDHRKQSLVEGHATAGYVFCNSRGGPLRRSHFHAQHYKPLLKAAELPAIRFHDLRHTNATLLLSAGVHPKVVQERLGHSQISVTMDIYTHVLEGMQREAVDKLGAMLGAATAKLEKPGKSATG